MREERNPDKALPTGRLLDFKQLTMVVGIVKIKFRLFDISSLKAKRRIVRSMVQRIKNKFNISIAETNLNDSYDWAEIGGAVVGNNARHINSKLDKVINMADELGLAMISDTRIEIIHL